MSPAHISLDICVLGDTLECLFWFFTFLRKGVVMRRRGVNKSRSARAFNKSARKTHRKNVQVMRGGYRL